MRLGDVPWELTRWRIIKETGWTFAQLMEQPGKAILWGMQLEGVYRFVERANADMRSLSADEMALLYELTEGESYTTGQLAVPKGD